jgi:hypothetical protein
MSRRRAPVRRWHVGDRVIAAYEVRMGYPPPLTRTYWRHGVVIAVRGDRVVVQSRGWEYTHPWWELREPPRLRHCHRRWLRR